MPRSKPSKKKGSRLRNLCSTDASFLSVSEHFRHAQIDLANLTKSSNSFHNGSFDRGKFSFCDHRASATSPVDRVPHERGRR